MGVWRVLTGVTTIALDPAAAPGSLRPTGRRATVPAPGVPAPGTPAGGTPHASVAGEAATQAYIEREFRTFVTERSATLLRTAYLLGGDWATAEDLLQIALTKTYLAWRRLGEIEAVDAYARRVLVNTATSWWRRRWHGERPTEVLPDRPAPDRIDERIERDQLWRHVTSLPSRQRAVLVLRYYEDLSEADTAHLLHISVGTVKSQCARAIATLRRKLAEDGIEPAAIGVGGGR
jgi:RNA polymerase sigma-70 factor (sigma-E family)